MGCVRLQVGMTACYNIGYLSTALMHLLPLYLTFLICRSLLAALPQNGIILLYHQFPKLVLLKMSETSDLYLSLPYYPGCVKDMW